MAQEPETEVVTLAALRTPEAGVPVFRLCKRIVPSRPRSNRATSASVGPPPGAPPPAMPSARSGDPAPGPDLGNTRARRADLTRPQGAVAPLPPGCLPGEDGARIGGARQQGESFNRQPARGDRTGSRPCLV